MPLGQSEEEVAEWFLTHDTTDYVDVSTGWQPNLQRAGQSVTGEIRADDLKEIQSLAESSKKSLAELIGILVHRGLNELRANPSVRL